MNFTTRLGILGLFYLVFAFIIIKMLFNKERELKDDK
jgi:hypothetical protein